MAFARHIRYLDIVKHSLLPPQDPWPTVACEATWWEWNERLRWLGTGAWLGAQVHVKGLWMARPYFHECFKQLVLVSRPFGPCVAVVGGDLVDFTADGSVGEGHVGLFTRLSYLNELSKLDDRSANVAKEIARAVREIERLKVEISRKYHVLCTVSDIEYDDGIRDCLDLCGDRPKDPRPLMYVEEIPLVT